jgi:hypothetical protein
VITVPRTDDPDLIVRKLDADAKLRGSGTAHHAEASDDYCCEAIFHNPAPWEFHRLPM